MMGMIQTEKVYRLPGSEIGIDFTLMTEAGSIPVQLRISDYGSIAAAERAALQQLEKILSESLEVVRQRLAHG